MIKRGRKRRMALLGLMFVALPLFLWGVVSLDRSLVTWVRDDGTPINLGVLRQNPLAVEAQWKSLPVPASAVSVLRSVTLHLDVPDARARTLLVRSATPLHYLAVNGRLVADAGPPDLALGTSIALPQTPGAMRVELMIQDAAMVPPPLLVLGTQRQVAQLSRMRLLLFGVLATGLVVGSLVILMNFIFQQRRLHDLTLWLSYMLLLFSQIDMLLPQQVDAELLRQAAMLLLSMTLCCSASLRLEGQTEGAVVWGLLIADSLLVALWVGGFLLLGYVPLLVLALPMQCVGFALSAVFAVGAILQSRAEAPGGVREAECFAILWQLVGLTGDEVLVRSRTLVFPPVLVFSMGMALVQLWLAAKGQAEDYHSRQALERQLELRVLARTEELRVANRQLSRIDASRGEFFSRIAHDLQSPLTIVRGSLDLVIDGTPLTKEERAGYLGMARSSAIKLANRIKALRGLALMEESDYNPIMQKVRPVVAACVENWVSLYPNNGVRFETQGDNLAAMFDAGWLQNALDRLVSNAVRYTPPGGSVTVAWQRAQFGVEISVRDTGCGIAQQDVTTLFERFYQGWNSREGLGIGLAVVQRVVQRHGGRVTAESRPGEGACFTMFFPDIPAYTWTPVHAGPKED
ncbi:MAG: HAMP domain-containing histidine kinase [Oscillospiraceae bacterium]|jgi:signal transduction histidine kinase|nr:HAMP domain-containing histidine kinase [Oscillospiraceae bacterium]